MKYINPKREPKFHWIIFLSIFIANNTFSQTNTGEAKLSQAFHLSAKPWKRSVVDKEDFLKLIEATCEVMMNNQNASEIGRAHV